MSKAARYDVYRNPCKGYQFSVSVGEEWIAKLVAAKYEKDGDAVRRVVGLCAQDAHHALRQRERHHLTGTAELRRPTASSRTARHHYNAISYRLSAGSYRLSAGSLG